jgi:WD40 repeat protein
MTTTTRFHRSRTIAIFSVPVLACAAFARGAAPLRTAYLDETNTRPQLTSSIARDQHGDPLPRGAIARLGTSRLRAPDACLAVSADGKRVVALGPDLIVRCFDTSTGASCGTRPLLRGRGTPIVIAPGGALALTTAVDPTNASEEWLHLWDLNSGEQLDTLSLSPFSLEWASFSPDTRSVALTDSGGRVRVWTLNTSKSHQIWAPAEEPRTNPYPPAIAWSPDGKRLATCNIDQSLRCWDTASGKLLWHTKRDSGSVVLLFSPDGRTLVSQENRKGFHVLASDATSGKQVDGWKTPPEDAVCMMGFSPEGRYLALRMGDEGAALWEPTTGKTAFRVAAPVHRQGDGRTLLVDRPPTNFAFTPDGSGFMYRSDILRRWDVATGKPTYDPAESTGHSNTVTRLLFTPDSRHLVSNSQLDHTVRVWNVATGQLLHAIPKAQGGMALTPDGRHLLAVPFVLQSPEPASTSPNISYRNPPEIIRRARRAEEVEEEELHSPLRMWDIQSGRLVREFTLPGEKTIVVPAADRATVHVSTDGKKLLLLTPADRGIHLKNNLSVWNLADGNCLSQRTFPGGVESVLTPDGGLLALERDGTVRLVSLESNRPRLEFQFDRARVEFHIPADPTGTLQTLMECALAVSPDRQRMAIRVRYPLTGDEKALSPILIGSMATGREIARLPVSGPAVLGFSADGYLLAVASRDAVRLWEIASGKEIGAIPLPESSFPGQNHSSVGALAFSPDGRTLATGHTDSTILLWDATLAGRADKVALNRSRARDCWMDLASTDASRAYATIWQLANNPAEAVPFLKTHLHPADSAAGEIRSAIRDLDSDTFAEREAAERRLRELSDRAEGILREALTKDLPPESRRRIEAVLAAVDPASLLSGEPLREVRAVMALEKAGNAEARELLKSLASGGENARLTRAARDALARLPKS